MPDEVHRMAKILLVDDEESNVRLLERVLRQGGYTDVHSTTDPRTFFDLYRRVEPDLVLLDLHMPHRDGFSILEEMPTVVPEDAYVPILVLTADATPAALHRALELGARDFLTKPFDVREVFLRLGNLLQTRFLHEALRRQNELLERRVEERTRQVVQMEKLSAMGQLLAGVAHELNNPLAIASGQAELLRLAAPDSALAGRAEKISQATERCVRIVRNFLALARERPPERTRVDFNAVVRDALELLGYELRTGGIEVRLRLADPLPPMWADPHQLHQVLVNLLGNAQHAMRKMPAPRTLTVVTEAAADGQSVRLTVSDTGPGIPVEIQSRIFDPFFTTKPVGEGTGLGLSLSMGTVKDHGGTIHVESVPGQGATFVVDLPVGVVPPARPEAPVERVLPAAGGPKRILVVDDETDVAGVLVDLLRIDGYEVETAPNGAEALAWLERQHFDAVLTDTKMPVLDGLELFEEMERRFPALHGHVGFVTGDILNREKREYLERTGAPTLAKPFDLVEIQRVVRRLANG
jgi:two-component system NtrC family sensor kinase